MEKDTSKSFNRRDFVKSSALAMGGLMAMPVGAGAYASGDDAIRVGLIGCGGRGTGAIVQALSSGQNVKLVAMADAFRDQLDKSFVNINKQEFKDWSGNSVNVQDRVHITEETKFVGFDAYKKVISMVDVVVIATPPGFRPIHFTAAIDAGKHVFMEKPLATDAAGVNKVLAAAKEAKRKKLNVVVGLQRHYQTVYREWVDRIHGGMIGDIHTAHVYWNGAGVWVRDRKNLERKAGRKLTEMEYQMRNWYYFNWLCGDHITEQHIHNLDVGNWVMNGYPVKANGMGGREVRKGKDHGQIFDHHFVEYEYANGARMYSQCRHIKGCKNKVSESFQGTNGRAPKPGLLETNSGYKIWSHREKNPANPYQVEHNELFAAIAKGDYKFADAENGAMSTMTSLLGQMATYSGQEVEMEAALASNNSIMPKDFSFKSEPPVMPDANGMYPVAIPGKFKPY